MPPVLGASCGLDPTICTDRASALQVGQGHRGYTQDRGSGRVGPLNACAKYPCRPGSWGGPLGLRGAGPQPHCRGLLLHENQSDTARKP